MRALKMTEGSAGLREGHMRAGRRYHQRGLFGLILLSIPSASLAQQISDPPTDTLLGSVVDANSGAPIAGAVITASESGVVVAISNGEGQFFIPLGPVEEDPDPTIGLRAATFGYAPRDTVVALPTTGIVRFDLSPAPVHLGELIATGSRRIQRRRNAAPVRVVAWEEEELAKAVAPDVGKFVAASGAAVFGACDRGKGFSPGDLGGCTSRRGQQVKLRVYIDEAMEPRERPTDRLWAFDPRDLWMVEYMPGCGELRIYTQDFKERWNRGRVELSPVLCEPQLPRTPIG